MTWPLETEQLEHDCIRVSMAHRGIEVVCFVSSFHLVEDKRPQLQRALQQRLSASEGV
jgi:hypothetical protein